MDTSQRSEKTDPRNLGDLMGLPASPSKDCAFSEPFSDLPGSTAPFVLADNTPRNFFHTKKRPLWMVNPGKYPRILETFRALENNIISFNENKKFKIFLISGAEEKVGVSTILLNLAIVLSRDLPEKRILLVDTNVINPFLNRIFEYSNEPCLMDYLFKKVDLKAIILPSCIPNLNLVFSSKIKDHNTAPFNIEFFVKFIENVRQNYDYILLDSAPALISSHTRSIAAKADGVILIAEANRTRREVIAKFQRRLKEDHANLIGSFLNKRRFFIPKWLYRFI